MAKKKQIVLDRTGRTVNLLKRFGAICRGVYTYQDGTVKQEEWDIWNSAAYRTEKDAQKGCIDLSKFYSGYPGTGRGENPITDFQLEFQPCGLLYHLS